MARAKRATQQAWENDVNMNEVMLGLADIEKKCVWAVNAETREDAYTVVRDALAYAKRLVEDLEWELNALVDSGVDVEAIGPMLEPLCIFPVEVADRIREAMSRRREEQRQKKPARSGAGK